MKNVHNQIFVEKNFFSVEFVCNVTTLRAPFSICHTWSQTALAHNVIFEHPLINSGKLSLGFGKLSLGFRKLGIFKEVGKFTCNVLNLKRISISYNSIIFFRTEVFFFSKN